MKRHHVDATWDARGNLTNSPEKNPKPIVTPAGCHAFRCEVCGPKMKRRWYQETKEAFLRIDREQRKIDMGMLTLTLRTKPSRMSWKRYIATHNIEREDLELAKKMATKTEESVMVQECNKYQRRMRKKYKKKESEPETWSGPIFRHYLEPRRMASYLNQLRRTLWKKLSQDAGGTLYYRGVVEFTKQGMAHMHFIVAIQSGIAQESRISRIWQKATMDSPQIRWRVENKENWDVGNIVGYIGKYLMKSKFDEPGWKGIRRHCKSLNLAIPTLGNKLTLRYIDLQTGAYEQFLKLKYERIRARSYYYRKKAEDRNTELSIEGELATKEWHYWQLHKMRQRDICWEVGYNTEVDLWEEEKYFWEVEGGIPFMQWIDGVERTI